MPSTRSFISPGIFAENASTVIPPTPISGVAYRDAVSGTDDTVNGWRYGTRVESQDWNQIMFLLTSMLSSMDKQGILGWSPDVDYDFPAITFGSNGLIYVALQASGPATAAQDPVSAPAYWERFSSRGMAVLSVAGTSSWSVPAYLRLGYSKAKVTVVAGGGGNQGGIGGDSAFGAFCSAVGGQPSAGAVAGGGGPGVGGDINIAGGPGGAATSVGADGGGSSFGSVGIGRTATAIYGAGSGGFTSVQAGAGAGGTAIKMVDLTGVTSVSVTVGAAGNPANSGSGIVIIEW